MVNNQVDRHTISKPNQHQNEVILQRSRQIWAISILPNHEQITNKPSYCEMMSMHYYMLQTTDAYLYGQTTL
jgi:hypothetical protein